MTKLFVAGFASYLCFALPQLGAFLLARRFGFSDGGLDAAGSAHMLTTVLLMPLMVEMVASFAVTAVHLMAASVISKQAVGLALAILAGLVASGLGPMSVPWLGWLFPAGISSAAGPLAGIVAPGGFATVVAAPHAGWLLTGAALAATVWVVVSVMAVRWKEAKR
jgi:lantibiotic transport system permease protein